MPTLLSLPVSDGRTRGRTRRRLRWGLMLWAALLGVGSAPSLAHARPPLGERLDAALRHPALRAAQLSILVEDEKTEQVIYERDPEKRLIPASNMKIMTALAALETFGPSHRFATRILTDRAPDASGTVGRLAVLGGGDPVLNSEDWWRLAADLRRRGLRRVEGDILVDDSLFDREYWHPQWKGRSARAYHAPVSALTANYGSFFIAIQPGRAAGDPVRVSVDPPIASLQIVNRAVTGPPESSPTLSVQRTGEAEQREIFTVTGKLPAADEPDFVPRSVQDAALYAGAVLKLQLEAVGIEVGGAVRRGSANLPHVLATHEGRSLAEIVRLFMKYSNNAMAESLVKSMAVDAGQSPGTWSAGLAAMRTKLLKLRLLGTGAVLADGSGLSTANRLSARMLVDALRVGGRSFRVGPEFVSAFPIASRDGTLENRTARSTDLVRAKTGLLGDQRVTALSGYLLRPDGDVAVFSILVNGHAGRSKSAMDAVDRFVAELTRR